MSFLQYLNFIYMEIIADNAQMIGQIVVFCAFRSNKSLNAGNLNHKSDIGLAISRNTEMESRRGWK